MANWNAGMQASRPWALGSTELFARNRIARLFFCFHAGMAVVLHGFIKKTQRTPVADLALARERMQETMQ